MGALRQGDFPASPEVPQFVTCRPEPPGSLTRSKVLTGPKALPGERVFSLGKQASLGIPQCLENLERVKNRIPRVLGSMLITPATPPLCDHSETNHEKSLPEVYSRGWVTWQA